jgi:ribosome biogenesis GTPase / thiamine phosphate phosphatase
MASDQAAAGMDLGLVVAAHGRHLVVETPERQRVLCHLRGKKTEAVVGDRVRWQSSGDEGVVEQVAPRRNLLFRQDEWRTKSFAANLDALLVLVAVEPPFSESQLTRALIAAQSAGVPAWIGLNKTDLPTADAARERLAPYRAMGFEVVEFALKADPDGAAAVLAPRLAGKTTLVLGPSGMGKSTLINRFVPQAGAQVGEISLALNAGKHTTTTTTWYWLGDDPQAGALIDSPGFQEFGLRHIEAPDLASLMPDLRAHLGGCRFYNCTHLHEPGCGVREAAELGSISPSRYRIYGELFAELSKSRY